MRGLTSIRNCVAETVLALMRSPEYCIYGAAKVDGVRDLDAGEDRFNEVLIRLTCLSFMTGLQRSSMKSVQRFHMSQLQQERLSIGVAAP